MNKLKINDCVIILDLGLEDVQKLRNDFYEYLENFMRFNKVKVEKEYFNGIGCAVNTDRICIYFSNSCVDNVIGVIFHTFCFNTGIKILDFKC